MRLRKMKNQPRYITTTLPYVNDNPHMGHVLEFVQADALARMWRAEGSEVFFNTGTDEHGQKILQKAQEEGRDVQEYVDYFANRFQKVLQDLNISNDAFIRTTDAHHVAAAQEIWKRCVARGDIYKKQYTGLYCIGCEMFVKESDLVDGACPHHTGTQLQEITEENYFFALSKYQDQLLEYLSREDCIMPDWRREEAINFVKNGLEDFSISREKERLTWGIPVPGDDSQVMYVWFDALTNYISTLGWASSDESNFKKFWQEGSVLQLAGKDQVRFQSIMWQAMLLSAGVKNTDTVFYHGFITSEGKKMSKSLGNVISPFEVVEKYGVEATRYILLRHVHATDDSDITWEKMDEWYAAHLVNGLGNLASRIMKLAETNLEEAIAVEHLHVDQTLVREPLETCNFAGAIDFLWEEMTRLDEHIAETEPYKVVKTDPQQGKAMITELVEELYGVSTLLAPFLPETSETILTAIKENKKPENLFPRL